jgi:DNA primase
VAAAADWFARQLCESPEAQVARDYLTTRHLDLETVQPLGLGYAPRNKALLDAMKGLGVRDEVLLEAGLLARREDGTLAPRFRGRLLFPIHDVRARVVGFGGRILGEGEPKYLNSPDTPIFHKGKLLYNLYVAKHAMRKAERAILVEGYFDVLRLSLAGIEEVVAPLGTALTPEQAQLLQHHAPHVTLLYDSDDAGLRATFRASDELLRQGLRVSVATLPPGEDPDTLVQKRGAAGLEAILKDAVDPLERKIQILDRKAFFSTLPGRRRALDRLLPTIRAAKDPVTRDLYLARVAEAAGVRAGTLENELVALPARPLSVGPSAPTAGPQEFPSNAEKALLLLMLFSDEWKSRVLAVVDAENFAFSPYRAVFEALADGRPDVLDGVSARVLESLQGETLGDRSADETFEKAIDWIDGDRKTREITRIKREMTVAPEGDKARLLGEIKTLAAERNAIRPTWGVVETARRRGAPGT